MLGPSHRSFQRRSAKMLGFLKLRDDPDVPASGWSTRLVASSWSHEADPLDMWQGSHEFRVPARTAHRAAAFDMTQGKRAQGRPARGDNEVGAHKIVEGMRSALRAMKTSNVTRKDIASHAGVTPALVTYYFPERNGLIEAATVPIVQSLVDDVAASFKSQAPARQQLVAAVAVLLEAFCRDGVILQLFDEHRSSQAETAVPDLLAELDACLVSFFERWLDEGQNTNYEALFLQKALIGICKCIGGDQAFTRPADPSRGSEQKIRVWMICSMLVGPAPVTAERRPVLCDTQL